MTLREGRNVDSSTFGQLLGALTIPKREQCRHIEKIQQKLNNAEIAYAFNLVCLKENMLPGYINIKLHDEEARNSDTALKFRKELVERQIQEKQRLIRQLKDQERDLLSKWNDDDTDENVRKAINTELNRLKQQHRQGVEARNIKKLSRIYGGNIKLPKPKEDFINLAPNLALTPDQEKLLNMGLNCHYMSKPRPHRKRVELECLLEDIQKHEAAGRVITSNNIQASFIAEAAKTRGSYQSRVLHKRHKEAAKQLRENDIIIRRADKTAALVIIPKAEYLHKMDNILSDNTKFKRITRNPTEDIKKRINAVVKSINAIQSAPKLPKLTGEYSLGYAYGTVKTHKPGNPLRPIISQIPTGSYEVAKRLNGILTPYVPANHSLSSTNEFLEILAAAKPQPNSILASLDVESLFTNVPVDTTIQFILDRVYRCNDTPTLDIPEDKLRELLEICTKEAPFTCPRGNMYQQIDGVAMGSPLGVLFANFYMGTIESSTLESSRPSIYGRYIDDIFVRVNDIEELRQLKQQLTSSSSLNFTFEEAKNGRLPFLDVLVTAQACGFSTTVYVKDTNKGLCLNGESECPERYHRSTINAYVRRALSHCSTWTNTHRELERLTQVLINNGYKNSDVQNAIRRAIDSWRNKEEKTKDDDNKIKLYYRNHMSNAYKIEESTVKDLVYKNVKSTDENRTIELIIYYKTKKTSQLLLKNNPTTKPTTLQEVNVIYNHICTVEDCGPHSYIGMTRTSLSRRLTCHLQTGAIKQHYSAHHKTKLTRQQLEKGTTILDREQDPRRLAFLEALYIAQMSPTLNSQVRDLQILPSLKRRSGGSSSTSGNAPQDCRET